MLDRVEDARKVYYGIRYREFEASGLLPLARHVALAFKNIPGQRMSNARLSDALNRFGCDPLQAKDFLSAQGYVWQDTAETDWTPGIPNLMEYMIEQTEPEASLIEA